MVRTESHAQLCLYYRKSDWPDFITDPSLESEVEVSSATVQELRMGEGWFPKKIEELLSEGGGADATQERTIAVPFGELITRHLISYLGELRPRERLALA